MIETAHLNDDPAFRKYIQSKVAEHPYFFHKFKLWEGLETPGWSDPAVDKLPYYGLPERMDGMRVLDIGCAEGYFSFEAERRGAAEVIAVDSFHGSIERFNIMREAFGSKVNAYLCNVYDISARTFGTFDFVMFFGVLYHLKHPWYALDKIASVCTGTMLLQTLVLEDPQYRDKSISDFHPFGFKKGESSSSGFQEDPTVFWIPTPVCTKNLVLAAGFKDVADVTNEVGKPFVCRATTVVQAHGKAPDYLTAPWS